jgi:hypothetical protein
MAKANTNIRLDAMMELERRGKLPPELQSQLEIARKQGVVKSGGAVGITAEDAGKRKSKIDAANLLSSQLDEVVEQYNSKLKGDPSGSFGAFEYLPTPSNKTFNAASQGLVASAKKLMRDSGEGVFTDADMAQLQTQIPDYGDYDGVNEQKIQNLRRTIDEIRQANGAPKQALGGRVNKSVNWDDM